MILSISGIFLSRWKIPSQFLKAMKLIALLLTVAFLQSYAKSYSQVTISLTNAPIEKVFQEIENQTGYGFLYTKEMLSGLPKVTIDVKNATIREVLNECLKGQSLDYTIDNNTIVITRQISVASPLTTFYSPPPLKIHGRVLNQKGVPLQNVSVLISGTNIGTATDKDGRFTLTVPDNSNIVLQISSIGYKMRSIKLGGKTEINVILEQEIAGLNDVVVVGYGTQKRKDLTGAISSVKPEQIAHLPALRVDQLLQGKVAGAQITSETGEPGTGTTIRIRGSRSITADNEPLYVVDGVLDAGDLNTINPEDIASIEVLKDASATAIYGSRGSNGVILITTKRGIPGKDVVSISSMIGFAKIPKYLDVMNAEQWATMVNENSLLSHPNDPVPYPNPDSLGEGTNWTKAVTRTAPFQSHTLSLNGGSKSFKYYLSGNYTDQEGIIKASSYKRYQFRINLNKQFSKTLQAGITLNYANSFRKNNLVNIGSLSGWYYSTLSIPPVIHIYATDGGYEDWNPAVYSGNFINTPVAIINLEKDNTKAKSLLSDFFVNWELLPGLSLRSSFSYLDNNTSRNKYFPGTLPTYALRNIGGYAYQYSGPSNQILNENLLTYRHSFNHKHNVNLLAGWTYQKKSSSYFAASGTGYFVDAVAENSLQSSPSKDLTSVSSGLSTQTIVSGLGRLNYNFKQKYYVTLTGRADGSSNFSANHKWAFFPSGAVKWQISNEDFMNHLKAISDLDLRLSYGSTGNQAIAPYQSLPKLSVNTNGYVFDGSLPVSYYPGSLPNDELTWETSREINLGMDVSFLKKRIKLTADVYNTQTKNLLLAIQVPQQTGYRTRLVNLGKTENKGLEILLNTVNVQSNNFAWSSIITYARNEQKVLDLGPLVQVFTHTNYTATQYPMYAYQVGLPTSAIFGAVYAGTWKSQDDIDANKSKYVSIPNYYHPGRPRYVDENGDGKLDQNDCIYLGQADPKFYGGLDNNFTYKAFEFDVYFEYSEGNVMYNDPELIMGTGSVLTNQFSYMLNRWNAVTNPNSDIPMVNSGDHVPNTRFVHKASYIRLKSLRIGYNFDPAKFNIKAFKTASLYISGTNLFLWTKYNGYDPEVNTAGSSSTVRRNDDGAYPSSRTIAVNLSLSF